MSDVLEHPHNILTSVLSQFPNDQDPAKLFKRVRIAEAAFNASLNNASDHGWANPSPLPNPLPKVAAFDAALLPEVLRPWVMDIANRMQCPPDYPAVAALVAISSLIGAKAVVQPKRQDTGWQVIPNLWGNIVGRPGAMKSPATGQVLAMIDRLEGNLREVWQSTYESWQTEAKLAKMTATAAEKKAAGLVSNGKLGDAKALLAECEVDPEPLQRRFIVNDATVEKLGEILVSHPWGVLSYRDELHGLLASLDKQGQEGSRSFYLQAFDGDKCYTFDRIGRGTIRLERVCLAMLGGIQPGRLQEYVRSAVSGGGGDDGLLQRFSLMVWPDQSKDFVNVDRWPDNQAKTEAWNVFERLSKLEPIGDQPLVWRFGDEAQVMFNNWRVQLETDLRTGDLHPALESHLAKFRKLVPALALIFALIDTPETNLVIGKHELLRAMAWAEYLRSHAERVYSAAVTPESTGAHTLLAKIKQGKLTEGIYRLAEFAPRQVAVKGWAGLNSSEAVRKACEFLCEYGWLRVASAEVNPLGGRPSGTYEIHPDLCGMMK